MSCSPQLEDLLEVKVAHRHPHDSIEAHTDRRVSVEQLAERRVVGQGDPHAGHDAHHREDHDRPARRGEHFDKEAHLRDDIEVFEELDPHGDRVGDERQQVRLVAGRE